jgi:catechol 2,3-dioxygenase-like lactoylglutathione lyase family enzyme
MAADILINIDVDDLDRATAFYTAAFGLRSAAGSLRSRSS